MRRHGLSVSLLLLVLFVDPGYGGSVAGPADDVAILRAHFVEWYTREAPETGTVKGYIAAQRPDGSWPDIDYANQERGGWLTHRHLTRTLALAEAYRKVDHPLAGNAALRTAILKGLGHWTENDYVNSNWWYPQIGVPQVVAPILILMGDTVPAELKEQTIQRVLGRSKMGMTGQNKVWLAGIAFMKGLLADDPGLMANARDQIFSELQITTREGVQPDYSFHQHGPQQQWGNYGGAFGADMIRWAGILRDTRYALDSSQVEVLRDYLQEGPAWILWQGRMDISGCGRQVFRECQSSKGRAALRQLESMKAIDPGQAEAYTRLAPAGRPDGVNTLLGHKHFWRSDITVHRRPTWYASVKMSSTRVIGAETCNGENLLGLHLGDGVTCFYRTGQEYEDLFPVWDWRRLPGTTCRQDQGSLEPNAQACRGQSSFVGGLSDGGCGFASMEYVRDGLRARKAWFFLDHAVVCLGAGIDGDAPETILTSVNQCALNGRVTIRGNVAQPSPAGITPEGGGATWELLKGQRSTGALEWVHHDGMGYVFLEPTMATVCAQTQSGDWRRVHSRESARTVDQDVFSLWLDHGRQPRGGRYAYIVVPNVSVAALPSWRESASITILQQTASVQAIASRDGKLVQAAFFEPGRLTWGEGASIEAQSPCLVMLDETASSVRLHVTDPTHTCKTLTLRLAGRYIGREARYDTDRGQTELTVDLPQEGFAGQTVRLDLQRGRRIGR